MRTRVVLYSRTAACAARLDSALRAKPSAFRQPRTRGTPDAL